MKMFWQDTVAVTTKHILHIFVFYHNNYRKNPKQTQQKTSCHCEHRAKEAPSYHSAPWELLSRKELPA